MPDAKSSFSTSAIVVTFTASETGATEAVVSARSLSCPPSPPLKGASLTSHYAQYTGDRSMV